MNDTDTQVLLSFASSLAEDAGVIMRKYFHGTNQQVSFKQDSTIVTIADTEVNDMVIKRVSQTFPEHGVRGEESSLEPGRDKLWVCDPIDGTNGFTIGEPTAVFSLAYVVDGVPQVAVTYDPFQGRLITAIKGQGTWCDGQALKVSPRSSLAGAVVAAGGSFIELDRVIGLYRALTGQGASVRMFGGIVFKGMLVAEGKIDGVLFPYNTVHDIAAVKLLVEEAGGTVTDIEGAEQRYDRPIHGAIFSNGVIHNELLEQVQQYGVDNFVLPSKQ